MGTRALAHTYHSLHCKYMTLEYQSLDYIIHHCIPEVILTINASLPFITHFHITTKFEELTFSFIDKQYISNSIQVKGLKYTNKSY